MASETLPSAQLGILTTGTSNTLQSFPVPSPGPNEVLIRNVAVASNPKDWKIPQWTQGYSTIEGNDVAGYIVKVGEGVTEYKGGERVAAFTKMATREDKYGAYQQYTVAPVGLTFPIPESTSFEEASTLPLAVMTAALGLFKRLQLPDPPAPGEPPIETKPDSPAIIVHGAASSVGAFTVQLAKRAGLFVVGTAGRSKDYAKSIGTDIVLDYRDYKTNEELEEALVKTLEGRSCAHVYDAITENGSTLLLARVLSRLSPSTPSRITFVLQVPEEDLAKIPPNVTADRTGVNSAYGDDSDWAEKFYRWISKYLEKADWNPTPFQPNRVKVIPEGLKGVPSGLELLRNGKVHGEKLVYRIAETPGIDVVKAKA